VEIGGHGEKPKVEKIEIENPHPLVTLPSDGMAKWEDAKELLRQFPDDIPAYIRLNVEIDDFLPVEANMEAEVLTENKQCRFCYINAKRKTVSPIASKALTVQEFQAENPIEIVKRYAEDIGVTFNEEMDEIFTQTIQMLNADSHDD
jgi:exonuclease SbcD